MKKTVIEEGVWDIKEKSPLKKAVFIYDGNKITRQLFILGGTKKKKSKVEISRLSINVVFN